MEARTCLNAWQTGPEMCANCGGVIKTKLVQFGGLVFWWLNFIAFE
jgi:hypothetical protein